MRRVLSPLGTMKFSAKFVLGIVAIFFLAACGGGEATPVPPEEPTKLPVSPTPVSPTPVSPTPTDLGTLEIRVTDQPSGDVTSIIVTVKNIEVNASGDGGDAGWRTVIAEPRQFDLVEVEGIEKVLGSATLEPGRYQQIRLEVVETVLTIRGNERAAAVPSGRLRIVGGFDVAAGATTILTLDFDAEKSIVFRPGVGPQLKPVVKLLVRKGSQSLAEASTVAAVGKEAPSTPPTATTAAAGLKPVRVVIPVSDNLQFMNFWVAQGAGFFQDGGLDVQVVVPPIPPETGRFMVMSRADVAVLTRPLFLESIGRGEPVLTFANLFGCDPINLVVKKEVAEERGLSADMPLAERLDAMRGLKVGVAPGPPSRLRVLFESVGLDAESDIEMVIVHGEEQNTAFADGTVDALYAHTPFLERALLNQGAVMIVNQSAGEVPALANRQYHTLVTTQGYASANPEVLLAMTKAVYPESTDAERPWGWNKR